MKRKPTLVALVLIATIAVVLIWQQPTDREPPSTPTTQPAATTAAPIVATAGPAGADRPYAYAGLPRSALPIKVLKNQGFVVGYSDTRKNPLWVAYRILKIESPTTHKRPSRFKVDNRTAARVSHNDYTRSGYDRGHMAPNYAIATRYGGDAQLETFLMSNICPQKPSLNRHVWKGLEMLVAKDYANRLEEVWIICGPIFDEQIERLASGVEIPDAFYKIIVDEKDGKVRVLAFVMPQGVSSSERDQLAKFLRSVDDVEQQTGLDFLHELPDDVEDRVEAEKARGGW